MIMSPSTSPTAITIAVIVVAMPVVASVPSVDFSVVPVDLSISELVVVGADVVASVPSVDFSVVPFVSVISEPVVVSPSVFEVGADVVYCESVTISIIELINQELIMHDMHTVLLMSIQ